jgi:hypothetical protein
MVGPTSARVAEAGFFLVAAISVVLLMGLGDYDYDYDYNQESSRGDGILLIIIFFLILIIFWLWLVARIKHKTHDCCQPWVLVKVCSIQQAPTASATTTTTTTRLAACETFFNIMRSI